MKHIFAVLFALALFCGLTTQAHANGFHVGATDPNSCGPDLSACTIVDANGPVTGFMFAQGEPPCNKDVPAGSFCIALFNSTLEDINSITLAIPTSALGGQTPICDTTGDFNGSCFQLGSNSVFSFTGGDFKPTTTEIIYVFGGDDTDFNPDFLDSLSVEVAATPEPDSFLLFATGVLMAGLYMAKRPLVSAFGKK